MGGVGLFFMWSQTKRNTAPPCITNSVHSLTKVYTNGIDMLKNIFLSHIKREHMTLAITMLKNPFP